MPISVNAMRCRAKRARPSYDLASARIQGKALADTCHACHHDFRTHD
jgi:cytochrome c556